MRHQRTLFDQNNSGTLPGAQPVRGDRSWLACFVGTEIFAVIKNPPAKKTARPKTVKELIEEMLRGQAALLTTPANQNSKTGNPTHRRAPITVQQKSKASEGSDF